MVLAEYVNSVEVESEIKDFLKNEKDYSNERKTTEIKNMIATAFNYGIFSLLNERKVIKNMSTIEKSKELTTYLPSVFKDSDMASQLVNSIMESIKTNSSNYTLNIGYEAIVPEDIKKVIQIVYAMGITAGFDISSNPDLKSFYQVNIERFIKHGAGQNV